MRRARHGRKNGAMPIDSISAGSARSASRALDALQSERARTHGVCPAEDWRDTNLLDGLTRMQDARSERPNGVRIDRVHVFGRVFDLPTAEGERGTRRIHGMPIVLEEAPSGELHLRGMACVDAVSSDLPPFIRVVEPCGGVRVLDVPSSVPAHSHSGAPLTGGEFSAFVQALSLDARRADGAASATDVGPMCCVLGGDAQGRAATTDLVVTLHRQCSGSREWVCAVSIGVRDALGELRPLADVMFPATAPSLAGEHSFVSSHSPGSSSLTLHDEPSVQGHRVFPKPTRQQRYMISADSDFVVRKNVSVQRTHRRIPKDNVFVLDTQLTQAREREGRALSGRRLTGDSTLLQAIGLTSRLDIHGHGVGTPASFEEIDPQELARLLFANGLRAVGILKVYACSVGKGDYLERLGEELNRLDVRVGYLSGWTADVLDLRLSVRVGRLAWVLRLTWIAVPCIPTLVSHRVAQDFRPERFILRRIKGNEDVRFPGTGYDFPREAWPPISRRAVFA